MEVEACLAEENLSLGTFAVRIGVSHETVRRYIRGSCTLQLTTAHRIAWATGGRVTALNSGEIIKSTGPLVQSATGDYPSLGHIVSPPPWARRQLARSK